MKKPPSEPAVTKWRCPCCGSWVQEPLHKRCAACRTKLGAPEQDTAP